MQKLLSVLIVFLIVFLVLVVAAVLMAGLYGSYTLLIIAESNLSVADRLKLLPVVAVSAGVLVAVLGFARERKRQEVERRRHVSEVLLERVKNGFDNVITLLSDQNNNRVTWVRAARTLLKTLNLKEKILSEEYKVAYNLEEERARNELYNVLTLVDEGSEQRVPLPPQFFYGIDDWRACKSLDEAAIKASSHGIIYKASIDVVPLQPYLKPLSPKSVIAIFNFLQYPEHYDDPLEQVPVWEEDWEQSHGIDQGARRYVAHSRQKVAINGKLIERNTKSN